MIFLNMLLLAVSIVLAVGIFCRLNKLDIKHHKFSVIIYNVGMLGAILSVGDHAWTDRIDLQDVCILIAVACWIGISYKSWEGAVPEYIKR